MKIKIIILSTAIGLFMAACGNKDASGIYGKSFEKSNPQTAMQLLNDTNAPNEVQLTGIVARSCQGGQCWLSTKTEDGKEIFIETKEQFKVPKNAAGHTFTAKGKWITVDAQKAKAIANGATQEEIAKIDAPSLEAEGIILEK